MLVSSTIRDAGGFYSNAEKLSKHPFSDFTVALIPGKDTALRTLHVSLVCSNTLPELPRCDPEGNVKEQIARGVINPLDFLQVENINRSKIFTDSDEYLPLNSIIQLSLIHI